jgi:hypothetical protein
MKKYTVFMFLFAFPFLVNGQAIFDTRIAEIRKIYQQTLDEKATFKTQEKDITDKAFSNEGDNYSKANVIYYYASDSELKLVILTFSSVGQYSSYDRNVELYYEKGLLCFLYSKRVNTQWEEVYEQKGKASSVMEERVYFDKNQLCFRYLIKEIEGKPEAINILQETTPNVEIDCADSEVIIEDVKKYL